MARVLIIDDDSGFREGLAETLADLGHEPIEAGDAAAGLWVLSRESIHLVFLDYRLPDIDGIEALARIHDRLAHLRQFDGYRCPERRVVTELHLENRLDIVPRNMVDHY